MHRETLEIRLATEELWLQLSGGAPPAALTRSLGRIRSRLADQYRLADAELKQQKKELEAIRRQLAEEHEKVTNARRQYERWAVARHEESEKHAARLVAREHQIDRREQELRERSQRWLAERLGMQRDLRLLQAELHRHSDSAVPA
jgi:septal ring factor EnvC (AmiA/AmiB activator)